MTALSDAAVSSADHTRAVKELRKSDPTGGTLAGLHVHA